MINKAFGLSVIGNATLNLSQVFQENIKVKLSPPLSTHTPTHTHILPKVRCNYKILSHFEHAV